VDGVGIPKLGLLDVAALSELVEGFERPKPGLVHACVAAFEASGRDRSELGIFEAVLPSLPGLRVLSILPFFSGDGVRDFLSPAVSGVRVELLAVLVNSLSRIEPVFELLRGVIEGRIGSGGGLPRSL
jgi:hypothetical protein